MMKAILTSWAFVILALFPAAAMAQDEAMLLSLPYLAATDPDAALEEIDALLMAEQARPEPDPRRVFDLYQMAVELLIARDRTAEAGQVLLQLAEFAARNRDVLDVDPAPLYDRAAVLLEATGDPEGAALALARLAEEYRDGARPQPAIDAVLERQARVTGVPLGAQSGDGSDAQTPAPKAATGAQASRGDDDGFREVEVFYATDRARTGRDSPQEFYGFERGELELGVATVTIPEQHVPGVVETPSIWRLEFRADPARHVVLQSIEPLPEDAFYGRLQSEFQAAPDREAFVFVHGYNVGFDQAARRAAQIAYDMHYAGVPILYSWPSRGSTIGYVPDTAVVRLSGRRLSRFLDDLVARSGAKTIHIVAHSMGNRALTDALELMALRHGLSEGDPPLFGQVLFAAPDVDAGLFREMLPTIRPIARRLTLYASQADWALVASRKLHGDMPRAGIGGADMLTDPRIDSIDMSELGEDMLAHNYFADDSSALADMITLFWLNTAPQHRCGLQTDTDAGTSTDSAVPAWYYRRGNCANRSLIGILSLLRDAGVHDPELARKMVRQSVRDTALAAELEDVVARIVAD